MSCLTPEIVERVWQLSDADGDGSLTWQEFHIGLNKHRESIGAPPIPADCVRCWFSGVDYNRDGRVSKQEYLTELLHRGDREEGLKCAFEKAAGKDGLIDREELKEMVVRLKVCDEADVDFYTDYAFRQADKDGSGGLTFEEFRAAMNKY